MTTAGSPSLPLDDCWNRIGVAGDGSCPELATHIHCRNCPVFASAAKRFFDRPASESYLREWAEQLGGPQQAAADAAETISMVIFRLRDEWLALATKVVVEVTPVRPIHGIPHRTNPIVAGLANLRGQLYLCASLHGLLGIEPSEGANVPGARARMIVIRHEHELWAITAEEVLGVNRVPREQLRNVPSTLANPSVSFSQAVFPWDGRSVGFLDEQRVFSGLRSMGR